MSSSDSESVQKNGKDSHVIVPSNEKPKLDTSNWPLLLKVRAYSNFIKNDQFIKDKPYFTFHG